MDCSPPGSSVHGILQARTLDWLPFPSPGDLPDPGMETACPTSADGFFTTGPPVKVSDSHSVMSDSLRPHGLYSPLNSAGQNTRVDGLSLLQAIFPTQGSIPGLLHCRWILYHLSHQGSPRILEWVAYPFSNISSWPRNWTGVSCIPGRFFTSWATREAPYSSYYVLNVCSVAQSCPTLLWLPGL